MLISVCVSAAGDTISSVRLTKGKVQRRCLSDPAGQTGRIVQRLSGQNLRQNSENQRHLEQTSLRNRQSNIERQNRSVPEDGHSFAEILENQISDNILQYIFLTAAVNRSTAKQHTVIK